MTTPAAEQAHEFEMPVTLHKDSYHPSSKILTPDRCVALLRGDKGIRSCGQPRSAAIHRLVTDAPAEQHCGHCDGLLVWGFNSYVHADPNTDCLAFGGRQLVPAPDTQATYTAHLKQCRICYHGLCDEGRRLWEVSGRQPAEIAHADIGSEPQAVPPDTIWMRREVLASTELREHFKQLNDDDISYTRTSTASALAEALRGMLRIFDRELPEASIGADMCAAANDVLARWEGKGES